MSAPTVEQLARALYETAPGTDGYRPLHETIPWKDAVMARETHIGRARTILALLPHGGVSPSATDTEYFTGTFTDRDVARFVAVLSDHALVEIRCDHDAKTDTPVCNCAVVDLGAHATVQKAREAWALHVWGVLRGGG